MELDKLWKIVEEAHQEAEKEKTLNKDAHEPDLPALYVGLECAARKLIIAKQEIETQNQKRLLANDLAYITLRKA